MSDDREAILSPEALLARRDRIITLAQGLLAAGDLAGVAEALMQLAGATTDQATLDGTDPMLPQLVAGRRVVASCDPARRPGVDEVVLIYGNYPHGFENVVVNNPVRRHAADFWRFRHDQVECDARWDGIDAIHVINLDRRGDRWDGVLRELVGARAPLDRVRRIPAVTATGPGQVEGSVACLASHLASLEIARAEGCRTLLVLEDDFCFTSEVDQHLDDLARFLEREYDYWVCLVATSKYGHCIPVDDLVARSHQPCTNAGGYLVSAAGIDRLLPVFADARKQLLATGDCLTHAADRCWSQLQPSGRFLVFRRKFGFQVSSYSDIEHRVARYLD